MDAALQQTTATTSSSSSPRKASLDPEKQVTIIIDDATDANVVPLRQRRGLLSSLTIIAEARNPKEHKRITKWLITFIVASAAAIITIGENIMFPALQATSRDLDASLSITNLSLSLSKISIAVCPLWWSTFSETAGRRTVYIISFTLFVLWSVLAAVSSSIGMLIAMRVLSQSAASSVQAIGAGTIADIWAVHERGTAMGVFYLGPLVGGTTLGPVLGGVLTQKLGWRATQWFLAIYGGFVLLMVLFYLPETLETRPSCLPEHADPAVTPATKAQETSTAAVSSGVGEIQSPQGSVSAVSNHFKQIRSILLTPFTVLLYVRFPALSTTILLASLTFGTLALQSISIQDTFSAPPYSMPTLVVGLLYLPVGLGNVLGSIIGGRWSDYVMQREARKKGRYTGDGIGGRDELVLVPEERAMENAWVGVGGYVVAFVWYGWWVERGGHWAVSILTNFLSGFSAMIIFGLVTTMLTEFVPSKPASAVALNSMGRNFFGCVGFAVAQPWFEAWGNGWVFTSAAIIMLVGGCGVVGALGHWGARWRVQMKSKLTTPEG